MHRGARSGWNGSLPRDADGNLRRQSREGEGAVGGPQEAIGRSINLVEACKQHGVILGGQLVFLSSVLVLEGLVNYINLRSFIRPQHFIIIHPSWFWKTWVPRWFMRRKGMKTGAVAELLQSCCRHSKKRRVPCLRCVAFEFKNVKEAPVEILQRSTSFLIPNIFVLNQGT